MSERTLVLVKPDGLQRALVGEIVSRFERRGLRLVGLKLVAMSREMAARHYDEHREKPFFSALVEFITASPVVAMVWEGPRAVALARSAIGATDPAAAVPGSIRGDLGMTVGRNLVHGSDSAERAAEEVALFFAPAELVAWKRDVEAWVVE